MSGSIFDEAPWEGPMTPEMWVDGAKGALADMCALAGSYGVDEDALNMMEGFGGNVTTALETLAAELAEARAHVAAYEVLVDDIAEYHLEREERIQREVNNRLGERDLISRSTQLKRRALNTSPGDTAYPEDESGAYRFPFAPGDTDN